MHLDEGPTVHSKLLPGKDQREEVRPKHRHDGTPTCRIEFWKFGLGLKAGHKVKHEPSLHLALSLTPKEESVLIACCLFFFVSMFEIGRLLWEQ